MKLKNYSGATMREALDRAKEELGDDFVLLESKELKRNGKNGRSEELMQVTVAVDTTPPAPPQRQPAAQNPFEKLYYQVGNPATTAAADQQVLDQISSLQADLHRLNRRLRSFTGADFPQPFDRVFDRLVEVGIGANLAERFIRQTYLKSSPDEPAATDIVLVKVATEILNFLESRQPEPEPATGPERIMIVGPTGVGKTTTIMKLAAGDRYGQRKTAILTTDTYRVAATAPLKAFSKIAKIPIIESNNPLEVAAGLGALAEFEVLLIDTPGRSPRFPNYLKELREYRELLQPTAVLLTLGMTAGVDDILLSTGLYSSLGPTGLILTKMDETGRPGKILSILDDTSLPLRYLTGGQSVPRDIMTVDAEALTNSIMTAIGEL
ncbi:MAG: hypothetical protein ABIA75_01640 [Candidatus Neomarinimicrobiota bacterium]